MAYLAVGDYKNGWLQHEWRWEGAEAKPKLRNFKQPWWLGVEQLEGKTILLHGEQGLGDFDFHCPLMSLPLPMGTTLQTTPFAAGYLKADPYKLAQWTQRFGDKTRPRVGLVWTGNPKHKNDHNRGIRLENLLAHLPKGCDYVSLQKEIAPNDEGALHRHHRIRHFGGEIRDFSDTAAMCKLMDLVVSVDTSVAHLAGALGGSTWILLLSSAD